MSALQIPTREDISRNIAPPLKIPTEDEIKRNIKPPIRILCPNGKFLTLAEIVDQFMNKKEIGLNISDSELSYNPLYVLLGYSKETH